MPEFLRVTDDVKPRREYTIVASSYIEGVHERLDDKEATAPDGTPLPPKYTPESLAASPEVPPTEGNAYDDLLVADLEAEIDRRNEGRAEGDLLSKQGKKADLVAALIDDDATVGQAPPEAPEELSS